MSKILPPVIPCIGGDVVGSILPPVMPCTGGDVVGSILQPVMPCAGSAQHPAEGLCKGPDCGVLC